MGVFGARRYRSEALFALSLVLGACTLLGPSRDELSAAGGASSGGASAAAGSAGDAAGTASGAGASDGEGGVGASSGDGGVGASSGDGGVGASGGDAGTGNAAGGGTGGNSGNDGSAGSAGSTAGGTAGTGGSNATGGGGSAGTGGKGSGGSAGTGGSGVVPRLPNLRLWMRADAGITLLGSAVTRWSNQAGSGPDAYQTVVGQRPSRDRAWIGPPPLVTFDGFDDQLGLERFEAAWSRGVTLFVVALVNTVNPGRPRPAALLSFEEGLTLGDAGIAALQRTEPVALRLDPGGIVSWEGVETSPQAYAVGRVTMFSVVHEASGDVRLFVNGLPMGTGAAALPRAQPYDSNFIGRGQPPLDGGIGEILLYDRALDEEERVSVGQYLTRRWMPEVR